MLSSHSNVRRCPSGRQVVDAGEEDDARVGLRWLVEETLGKGGQVVERHDMHAGSAPLLAQVHRQLPELPGEPFVRGGVEGVVGEQEVRPDTDHVVDHRAGVLVALAIGFDRPANQPSLWRTSACAASATRRPGTKISAGLHLLPGVRAVRASRRQRHSLVQAAAARTRYWAHARRRLGAQSDGASRRPAINVSLTPQSDVAAVRIELACCMFCRPRNIESIGLCPVPFPRPIDQSHWRTYA
jgi:hypothetical protein